MDQPGKVANPARGQLNRENNIPLSPCAPENLVSRDGFSRPVPRQPAHLHTQAESGAYLRDSSRVPRRRPFMKPPYAIGSVPSLSGHAIAYRWRSLPRVRRHRASKPQGSSERVLPWQITMDRLIFASLSHTHYWYEVGMLKVPADSSKSYNQPGKVDNSARGQLNRENGYLPVPVRAREFGLARRFWQSRPVSACSSPFSRLKLVLTYYVIPPEFRGGIYLFI